MLRVKIKWTAEKLTLLAGIIFRGNTNESSLILFMLFADMMGRFFSGRQGPGPAQGEEWVLEPAHKAEEVKGGAEGSDGTLRSWERRAGGAGIDARAGMLRVGPVVQAGISRLLVVQDLFGIFLAVRPNRGSGPG